MPFNKELFISRSLREIVRRKQRETAKERGNVLLPQCFKDEEGRVIYVRACGQELGLPEDDVFGILSLQHGRRILKEGIPPKRKTFGCEFAPDREFNRPKPQQLTAEEVQRWKEMKEKSA